MANDTIAAAHANHRVKRATAVARVMTVILSTVGRGPTTTARPSVTLCNCYIAHRRDAATAAAGIVSSQTSHQDETRSGAPLMTSFSSPVGDKRACSVGTAIG